MKKTIEFLVYFEDLTETAQHYLCRTFRTNPDKENWDIFPLTTLTKEIETEEKEKA